MSVEVAVWVDGSEDARGTLARASIEELAELVQQLPEQTEGALRRLAAGSRVSIGSRRVPDPSQRADVSARALLEELDALIDTLRIPDLRDTTLQAIASMQSVQTVDDPEMVYRLRPDWLLLRDAAVLARRSGRTAWVDGVADEGGSPAPAGPARMAWQPVDFTSTPLPWDGLRAALRPMRLEGLLGVIEEHWLWGRWCQRCFERRLVAAGLSPDAESLAGHPVLTASLLGSRHPFAATWTWSQRPGGEHWAATLTDGRVEQEELEQLLLAILATLAGAAGLLKDRHEVHVIMGAGWEAPVPDLSDLQEVFEELIADRMPVSLGAVASFLGQCGGHAELMEHSADRIVVNHHSGVLELVVGPEGRLSHVVPVVE